MKLFLTVALFSIAFLSDAKPKKEKWIQLFNGKNLKNWTVKIHHHEVGDNFGNTFRAEDGVEKNRLEKLCDMTRRQKSDIVLCKRSTIFQSTKSCA